jgi:3-methylcrotonyl-CoA carboxylase alpha subunit
MHTRICSESHLIGPAPASESYLAIDKLIDVAKRTGAQCVHPGYGFLSERSEFAEACEQAGIVFVGPPASAIRQMGLKDQAKMLVERRGVPVLPGYHGDRQDPKFLKEKAYEIGYPVLIKAVAGGGGRGMRRVDKHAEFDMALAAATREAQSAFGDDRVMLEKYVNSPRHIEVQIFGDAHGEVVHLYERDCSMQRRHQKVIEESPAPGISLEMRQALGRGAVAAAKTVGYVGAGTVEFIADATQGLKPDRFWFLEMNTRLQVEHPVTEAVTGLDLVEWQFRVAAGEPLPMTQMEVPFAGHAIEARLYAEDPEKGFLPSTGRVVALQFPAQDLRVDAGVETGDEVTPYYDPMIAKVIARADTREAAIDRLRLGLERTVVVGPRTNLGFLIALIGSDEFREGEFDTGFIDRNLAALGAVPQEVDHGAAAAGAVLLLDRHSARVAARARSRSNDVWSPWNAVDAFQLSAPRQVGLPIVVDGEKMLAQVSYEGSKPIVRVDGVEPDPQAATIEHQDAVHVVRAGRQTTVRARDFDAIDVDHLDGDGVIAAPMHGKVLAIMVEPGSTVVRGQRVAIIEAMKMEHALSAPFEGTVSDIAVAPGAQVAEGARVMTIDPTPAS